MVVISIISLLSSITFYTSTSAKNRAEDVHMRTEVDQVKKAIFIRKLDGLGMPVSNGMTRGTMYQEGSTHYVQSMNQLVSEGYFSEIPRSPSGDSYWYGVSEGDEEGVFAAELNYEYDRNTSNSCAIVETSQNYESCIFTSLNQYYFSAQNGQYCAAYLEDNPDQICVLGSKANFCSLYNQNGEQESYCQCTPSETTFCGPYGGNTNILGLTATVCDIGQEVSGGICSGSSDSDFCSCI